MVKKPKSFNHFKALPFQEDFLELLEESKEKEVRIKYFHNRIYGSFVTVKPEEKQNEPISK